MTQTTASKRPIAVSLVVAIAFFMQFLDTTAVNTALPAMAESFGTDVVRLSSGVTSYMIALAIFIPASGWIADRFGTRIVFCSAIAFFIFSSILCGTSQTLMQFVIYRIMQGMAGAMMSPVGRLAVLKTAPKEDLPTVMNYITMPALVAPIVGPLIGGYLTTYWSWRWIFYLNVPISIVCILAAWHYIPKDRTEFKTPPRFDFRGFILSGVSLTGFMYGVELFSKPSVALWVPVVLIFLSLVVLRINVKDSARTTTPLIDYSIMKIKTYRITILVGSISRMLIGVFPYLLPLMLQEGFGLSPFEAGSLFLATMVGNLVMKSATVWIIRHYPFRRVLIVNGVLSALFLFFTAWLTPDTPVWMILLVLFVTGMSRSLQFSTLTALAFADIPQPQMTSANTLYSTIQQMSIGMGVAIGAVALHFSALLHHDTIGKFTVPDFSLSFIVVAIIGIIHLVGYTRLPLHAGMSVRIKKHHNLDE